MTTDDKTVQIARNKLIEYLDNRRMRKTPERFAILDVVYSRKDHFNVEAIVDEMKSRSFYVSRATVYNTMELFCACGIIRKHQFGTRESLYEKIISSGSHHHLICSECGKIKEVKDSELLKYIGMQKYGAFNVSYFSLYVYGVCSSCMRRKKKIERENKLKK